MSQIDIFGDIHATDIHPFTLAKKVMRDKPATWRSHRLLMYEVAKELGVDWEKVPKEYKHILQELMNLSPDFERAARKVREEDRDLQRTGIDAM